MATIRNESGSPITLSDGHVLSPGDDPYNVDPTLPLEASLIASHKVIVVDGTLTPPAPANPVGNVSDTAIRIDLRQMLRALGYDPVSPTPTQTLTAIHAGLDQSAITGGVLIIPDSTEPWYIDGPIIPPPNAKMMSPAGFDVFHEMGGGIHGLTNYSWPPLPDVTGHSTIRLADNANCAILVVDPANYPAKAGPARGNGTFLQRSFALGITFDAAGGHQTTGTNGTGDLASNNTVSNATGAWAVGDPISGPLGIIPTGARVTAVVGSTLTFDGAPAANTLVGAALTKPVANIYVRDAWGVSFPYCTLVNPRGRGIVFSNSGCNSTPGFKAFGSTDTVANGSGDVVGTGGGNATSTTINNATGAWATGDLIAGGGLPGGAYVSNVAGSTITVKFGSTTVAAAAGSALSKITYYCTEMFTVEDSSVDSMFTDIDVHGARNSVCIDSAYGYKITGQAGFSIGGHNIWVRHRQTASPNHIGTWASGIDMRADAASMHNCRVDAGVDDTTIEVRGMSPGAFGKAADADGGWCTVFADGDGCVLRGVGSKGQTSGSQLTALLAYGPNAGANRPNNGRGMAGGKDMAAGTRLFQHRPADINVPGSVFKSSTPEPPPLLLMGAKFEPVNGSTAAKAAFNSNKRVAMSLPKSGSTESVIHDFVVPPGCNALGIHVFLVNMAGAGTGNVRIQVGFSDVLLGGGQTPGDDEYTIPAGVQTIAMSANFQSKLLRLGYTEPAFTPYTPVIAPGDPAAIRVQRLSGDAGDTFAGAVGLYAVRIEPVLVAP